MSDRTSLPNRDALELTPAEAAERIRPDIVLPIVMANNNVFGEKVPRDQPRAEVSVRCYLCTTDQAREADDAVRKALLEASTAAAPHPLHEAILAKRYTADRGMDAEMEAFNAGLEEAAKIVEASTAAAPADEREALATRLWKEATATGQGFCPSSWSGHWMEWYRMRADAIIAARGATEQAKAPVAIDDAMVVRACDALVAFRDGLPCPHWRGDDPNGAMRAALEAAFNG